MSSKFPPHMINDDVEQRPARGRCISCICFSWKVFTCIVSHVTLVLLVVSYCVGGAYLFLSLEGEHEQEVKRSIPRLRQNLTRKIWRVSDNASVLDEEDWKLNVMPELVYFEQQILTAMKTNGWDGEEDPKKTQWTWAGSLFYSIIVITTIGYGHISPHTDWGKVTTIFYAIVGIPLMLLCLSNIGDVMATTFRFIYWRICCYVCTRTSKRPRRSRQRSIRAHRYSSRSQPPPSFRRSMKLTQRSANDSGVGVSIGLSHAYSDPELRSAGRSNYERDFDFGGRGDHRMSGGDRRRQQQMPPTGGQRSSGGGRQIPPYDDVRYHDEAPNYTQTLNRGGSRFSGRQRNRDRMRDRHTVERERYSGHARTFDSLEDINALSPPAKRTLSVRSVRSPNLRRDEITRESRESRESRELNRLNSHSMARGRSVPSAAATSRGRAKSMDPRASTAPHYQDIDEEVVRKTPIISNRYVIEEADHKPQPKNTSRSQSMPRSAHHKNQYNSIGRNEAHNGHVGPNHQQQRHQSPHPNQQQRGGFGRQQQQSSSQHSRFGNRLELPEFTSSHTQHGKRGRSPRHTDMHDDEFDESYLDHIECGGYDDYPVHQTRQRERRPRRERSEKLPPSPRIMSPMGFAVKRQIRRRPSPSYDYDDDSVYGDDWSDYYGDISPKDRPVPIWLCVFLVISYILGGAALFAHWEQWSFLDSAYFCFITLTTIGFGDFVPSKGVKDAANAKNATTTEQNTTIALCSLYLLFGIALLAMSFNLVQEEFIANVKEVAKRLGILKDDEDDD